MFICVFNCNSQRMRRFTSGIIPANSNPNIVFKFNFNTPEWDLVQTKTAVFSYRGKNYPEPLDENNMCTVPAEVLHQGYFQVSVHGGGIITNMVRVPVTEEYKDSEIGEEGHNCKGGKVFVPEIDDRKILSWTIQDVGDSLTVPAPTDLNPFDEWENDETTSDYIWEEE